MECPVCKCKTEVEIDIHSDGFAENLQECGKCGALWTTKGSQAVLIDFCIRDIQAAPTHR